MRENGNPEVAFGDVLVRESGEPYRNEVFTHSHHLIVDEPVPMGGNDEGPRPTELLLSALGSCISITLRMYAEHKGIDAGPITVGVHRDKNQPTKIEVDIRIEGDLDAGQLKRMRAIAGKCPVHKLLTSDLDIVRTLELAPSQGD
jgi:putative redox protein